MAENEAIDVWVFRTSLYGTRAIRFRAFERRVFLAALARLSQMKSASGMPRSG